MSSARLLVFPSGMHESVAVARVAGWLGLEVVEATSEQRTAEERDRGVLGLPYVTESGFKDAFLQLIATHQINQVFTPHSGVWACLDGLMANDESPRNLQLVSALPHVECFRPYKEAYDWAAECLHTLPLACPPTVSALSPHRYAGLHHALGRVPGQSDETKIWLLAQVFRFMVPGDIVEIGSAYGRSAFALAWLAQHHGTGSVICVDPWSLAAARDQGEQAELINSIVALCDRDQIFASFLASLSGFGNVNYIRAPSAEAVGLYEEAAHRKELASPEFGKVPVSGHIALIHIDGNHKYEEVCRDIHGWLPRMINGGWILLDDYVWAFGDGPKRAGDELLGAVNYDAAFVVGDTLCIRLV